MKNNKNIKKQIKGKISSFEEDRRQAMKKTAIAGVILFPFGLIFMGIVGAISGNVILGLITLFFFIGIFALLNYVFYHDLKTDFKKEVVGGLIKQFSPHLSYAPSASVKQENFEMSRLFSSRISSFKGEDLIYGQIGDTHFQLSELSAFQKNGKNQTRVFTGIFIEADFHKHFHSETYIKPETILSNVGLDRKKWAGARLTHFENPKFESEFRVFTTDDQDARYILSPIMMQRILDLQNKFSSDISISFRGSKMYIAISTGHMNLFDRHTDDELDPQKTYDIVASEVEFILSTIDDLNLNTRIWSKQDGLLDLPEIEPLEREDNDISFSE